MNMPHAEVRESGLAQTAVCMRLQLARPPPFARRPRLFAGSFVALAQAGPSTQTRRFRASPRACMVSLFNAASLCDAQFLIVCMENRTAEVVHVVLQQPVEALGMRKPGNIFLIENEKETTPRTGLPLQLQNTVYCACTLLIRGKDTSQGPSEGDSDCEF